MLPFFLSVKGHNNFVNIYKKHVAIIGAGISGLALGIVLKKHNIPCVIFEKLPCISEYGAGISISRNGQKVLKEFGVLDQLKLISGNPKKANFSTGRAPKILTIDTIISSYVILKIFKINLS